MDPTPSADLVADRASPLRPLRRNSPALALGLIAAALLASVLLGLLTTTLRRSVDNHSLVSPALNPATAAPTPPHAGKRLDQDIDTQPLSPVTTLPPLSLAEVSDALALLLGRPALLTHVQTGDFPRRFVATVDNLARSHAPAQAWPVNPTPGWFEVTEEGGTVSISPDNGLRYAPFVLLLESMDTARAVDLYLRMLPLLQDAYEQLGYPQGRFHARLLEVVEHLLAAPESGVLPAVRLSEISRSERPWVHYEFADPDLEAATSGQKLMVRIGPVNERRVKAWLSRFRRELASRVQAR